MIKPSVQWEDVIILDLYTPNNLASTKSQNWQVLHPISINPKIHWKFDQNCHILVYKASVKKFQKIVIIESVFFEHSRIKLQMHTNEK